MNAMAIGVVGIILIGLGALAAAAVVVLVIRDPSAITAAKDYILVAATAIGTLGGFISGVAYEKRDKKAGLPEVPIAPEPFRMKQPKEE